MIQENKTPFFSIIIPTYNRALYVPTIINCLKEQTFQDFEIIIVDDGVDDIDKVIDRIDDGRIRLIRRFKKLGVSSGRNCGAEAARGEYIGFLDDDDEVTTSWLQDFYDVIMKDHSDLVLCGMKRIDHRTNIVKDVFPENRYNDKDKYGVFLPGAWVVKKEVFFKAGAYDEKVLYGENTELAIRLRKTIASKSFINKLNYIYVPSLDGGSKNLKNKVDSNLYVMKKHESYFSNNAITKKLYLRTTAMAASQIGQLKLARKLFREALKMDRGNLKMQLQYLLLFSKHTVKMMWKPVTE